MTPHPPLDTVRSALDSWFSQAKRVFPWRENPTPYAVLVSEIMLQQTQASRVLLYFSRWMERFPSLEVLAQAFEEEVIKVWEGLGYYRRARALHKAAQTLVKDYGGILPQDKETLLRIPGIGPYTAGAILSFAFHKRAIAIDANVERVIRRLYGISYSNPRAKVYPNKLKNWSFDNANGCRFESEKTGLLPDVEAVFSDSKMLQSAKSKTNCSTCSGISIQSRVEALLPQENAWHIMEGLIELGALLKSRKSLFS